MLLIRPEQARSGMRGKRATFGGQVCSKRQRGRLVVFRNPGEVQGLGKGRGFLGDSLTLGSAS